MARKHKHPEHENLERWLVSYADFMTLLFATFTALYALAQTDAARLKDVGQAIREGFEEQSIFNGIKSVMEGRSAPNRNPDPLSSEKGAGSGVIGKFESMTYRPGEIKAIKKLASQLMNDIDRINRQIEVENRHKQGGGPGKKLAGAAEDPEAPIRPVEASVQERGLRISFDSRMLFAPGSAILQPSGLEALDAVANRLKKFDNNRIHVEGHTDNQPIATALYPSNWELSTARAGSVVRHLVRRQFNPSSLVAVGYADTQPLANNQTPDGRARNRRVDIILYSARVSMLLNPRVQYLKEKELPVYKQQPAPSHSEGKPAPPSSERKPVASQPTMPGGPVKVIIRDKDGTETILEPKTVPVQETPQKGKGEKAKPLEKSEQSTQKDHDSKNHISQ